LILIDSNIWAYYFDSSLDEHKSVVKPIETSLKKEQAVVNATVVIETLHYLVKRLGPIVGGEKGRVFTALGLPLFQIDSALNEISLQKLCEFTHLGIGGRDASILATMEIEDISQIMTHDQAFKRIPDIKVIDPI
jgi:predicted nucleic acid-binding protein